MESILQKMIHCQAGTSLIQLTALIDQIRPARPNDHPAVIDKLTQLSRLLETQPEYRAALRTLLNTTLANCTQVRLYSDTGILANEGFFATL